MKNLITKLSTPLLLLTLVSCGSDDNDEPTPEVLKATSAQAGFSVQPRLKGEPTQEEYTIEADGKMTITLFDQKGATFGNPYVGSKLEVKGQLGPDYLGQYLTRISTRLYEGKAIAADGSFSETTITWGGNADANDPNRDTEVTTGGATGTTRGVF